jgi:hypothetical protein
MTRISYELTGLSFPWLGLQWQKKKKTDKTIARAVINFLEDRRLLFGSRHLEDEIHCVMSAQQIRVFLTERLTNDDMGDDLADVLKAMRATVRKFVEAAGVDARNFTDRRQGPTADPFSMALGDLRSQIGFYLVALAAQYKLSVDDSLGIILPPMGQDDDDELFWVPGFGARPHEFPE